MPWDGKSFAARHNHSLKGAKANKAAKIATAMVNDGVPEGEAIATANKRVKNYDGPGKKGHSSRSRTGKSRSWTGA